MKTVGFPISLKENERRRALLPSDVSVLAHPGQLVVQSGYGICLGFSDAEYARQGCRISDLSGVMACDVLCDPKIGDEPFLADLRAGQAVFGWVHAVQNRDITDRIVNAGASAFCWEDMFDHGRHVFWRNNELAGEVAVLHAFLCWGEMPYNCKVAVLGRGNVARGALKSLYRMGADVTVYDRHSEESFRREMHRYDVLVNAILWDPSRTDHIVRTEDLRRLRPHSLIIDISCDRHGGIESSEPTTIDAPTYERDGVVHYAVDHTPALIYKTVSASLSGEVVKYLDQLIEDRPGPVLQGCLSIRGGQVLDQRILDLQRR